MLPPPEPVGQDAGVAPLVGLAALFDAKEHHPLGPVSPELEAGLLGEGDVAPEPGDGWGGVAPDLELHIGVLLLVGEELVLAVLRELGGAGQAPRLERRVRPGEDNSLQCKLSIVTFILDSTKSQMLGVIGHSVSVIHKAYTSLFLRCDSMCRIAHVSESMGDHLSKVHQFIV